MSKGRLIALGCVAVAGLVLTAGATTANAQYYTYYHPAPVYVAPVYAPAPVVYAPPPVVYARPAVVCRPPVVYAAPVYRSYRVYGGYHGHHHHHRSFSFGFGYTRW
jgi:hypothetical protein